MKYSPEFLAQLRVPRCITVTGPQRAGTRIATAILARDLGRQFVGEEDYEVSQFEGLFSRYLDRANRGAQVVIHAPALSSVAHHMPGLVVFMRRDPLAIARSQKRINWAYEDYELVRYFAHCGPVAEVAYRAWDEFQKTLLEGRGLDLDYDSLAGHDLWIAPEQRTMFHPHQITPKDAPIRAIQYRS